MFRHLMLAAGLAVVVPVLAEDAKPAVPAEATPAPAPEAAPAVSAEATAKVEAPAPAAEAAVKVETPIGGVKLKAAAATKTKSAAAPAKPAAAPVKTLTPEDIDLWSFTSSTSVASAKTVDEFKAVSGFVREKVDLLTGDLENKDTAGKPTQVTLYYQGGLRVRVINYGTQAFLTQVRADGPGPVFKDNIKVGSARAEVEASLGRPNRGGGSYTVYQGKTDTVRFTYTNNLVTSIEIDRGS
jgi:hypothetical protein